jgi:histidyl-tRNA synthetase
MHDIDNNEFSAINFVRENFMETCRIFDIKIMEPTPIEMLGTLEVKSGEGISKETYSFEDKGGRQLALRFDLTVGMTRYVVSRRDLKMPIKLAAFSGVWRYDEPQAGRYRYFHQWDIEIYGPFNTTADAEVIEFVAHFFDKLGLKVTIHVNDRKLIEEYIRSKLGISSDSIVLEMFRAIDKVPKKGPEQVLDEYKGRMDSEKLSSLISISKAKGSLEDVASQVSDVARLDAWSGIASLMDSLKNRGIKNATMDLGIVRGLDYYSGSVFEVFDTKGGAALVGGGRYDSLTKAFGRKDLGATGAAGGIERIISALSSQNLVDANRPALVYVAYIAEDSANDAVKIASSLRRDGVAAAYDLSGRALKKQLEDAAARGAAICVIAAHNEIATGKVTVRSMNDGSEQLHQLNKLGEFAKTSLGIKA